LAAGGIEVGEDISGLVNQVLTTANEILVADENISLSQAINEAMKEVDVPSSVRGAVLNEVHAELNKASMAAAAETEEVPEEVPTGRRTYKEVIEEGLKPYLSETGEYIIPGVSEENLLIKPTNTTNEYIKVWGSGF